MAETSQKHPYLVSPGILKSVITKFRSSLPDQAVSLQTLKKLSIASGNEKQIVDIFKFLSLLDKEGKPTDACRKLFNTHDDDGFKATLAPIIENAYADLFKLNKETSWLLSGDELIGYFRQTDNTSASTGQRQAIAFTALAVAAGKRQMSIATSRKATKPGGSKPGGKRKKSAATNGNEEVVNKQPPPGQTAQPAVAINIQLTLPEGMDEDGFEKFFAAMKKHLWPDK
ncbi:MAG: DUF5343 domain-containing protein [Armatimonadetes bacterium]|nr:DUF5343 domain-containing protein [Armatimonadota bacterium]